VIRAILVIVIILLATLLWIVEPISYNPFHHVTNVKVESSLNNSCTHNKNLKKSADHQINQYLQSGSFLGLGFGFSTSNCGTYIASVGLRDKGNQLEVNATTVFRIASITKPMTAVAIMQLYERGLVDLDMPIQTYLPELTQLSTTVMTIRQLLSHTSGMPHYASKLDAMSFSHHPTLTNAADSILEKVELAKPNIHFVYSSFGYTLLGAIIERVSNQTFEEYMAANIWQVAGMLHTSVEHDQQLSGKSKLYLKVGGTYIKSPQTDLSTIYSAGGVQSTVQDILLFGQAIIDNKLITNASLELMTDVTYTLSPNAGDDPYGLGWYVYNDPATGKRIAHGGSQPGAGAYFEVYLDKKLVTVALSNAFGTRGNTYTLSKDIANMLLNAK